jgi:hypothetical protein
MEPAPLDKNKMYVGIWQFGRGEKERKMKRENLAVSSRRGAFLSLFLHTPSFLISAPQTRCLIHQARILYSGRKWTRFHLWTMVLMKATVNS